MSEYCGACVEGDASEIGSRSQSIAQNMLLQSVEQINQSASPEVHSAELDQWYAESKSILSEFISGISLKP